ncbi:hypothetical protein ABD77_04865 [Brevibacillus formosus]|nr:hypothetical protein [Brevibacillus formosus]
MVANRTILTEEYHNEQATWGVLHAGLRGWKQSTIDPLHLIRIMPAQGYGCRQTALFRLIVTYAYVAHLFLLGNWWAFCYEEVDMWLYVERRIFPV